jgi:hypothetical protein
MDAQQIQNLSSADQTPANTLAILRSIVVPGNRSSLHSHNIIQILLNTIDIHDISSDNECTAAILHILSQVLDDADRLTSDIATVACRHAVAAMQRFPEDREVLSHGAATIWVCAAKYTTECLGEGAYQALESASKVKKHFANLEVGKHHPFRFKLGVIGAALGRLTET